MSKKYGLIIKNLAEPSKQIIKPVAAAFCDDEDEFEPTSSKDISASTIRVRMQARREHEKALAEDATIFDYDNIYDELQAKKNEKIAEIKAADKDRKSKYAEQILETHKKRVLAQQSREERKQQKEREAEAGKFDDKEACLIFTSKFVTSSYRKQLIEMESFRLKEAVDNRLDELTAVEKQKSGMWASGFYRTLLNDISRDNSEVKTEVKDLKQKVADFELSNQAEINEDDHSKKLSLLRKNTSMDDTRLDVLDNKSLGRSTYSDASDEEREMKLSDPVKLKPGLNILKPKKPTKVEQIRQRFTPSPGHRATSSESTSEEYHSVKKTKQSKNFGKEHGRERRNKNEQRKEERSSVRHRTDHHHSVKQIKESKESGKKQKVENENSEKSKVKIVQEKTKEERLHIIKQILAHRNGPEKIEELRQRYIERKKEHVVPLPF